MGRGTKSEFRPPVESVRPSSGLSARWPLGYQPLAREALNSFPTLWQGPGQPVDPQVTVILQFRQHSET